MKNEEEQNLMKSIGQKIKRIRMSYGYTQKRFSIQNNLTYRHYQDIEGGKINCKILTLLTICKGLKIELTDLLDN